MSDTRPLHDPERLESLTALGLGAAPGEDFDRYTRLVTRLLGVPVSLVSLVDDRRQYFPGMTGLVVGDLPLRETPLSHSFCQYVVDTGEPLVVTDALQDALVCDNLAIPDLGVVGYAGMPLTDADGRVLGSLCAIDTEPREWTQAELETLRDIAHSVSSELRLRRTVAELRDLAREVSASRKRVAEEQDRVVATQEEVAEARGRELRATGRLALLADLGEVLLHSMSRESVHEALLGLLVPRVVDGAAVDLLTPIGTQRLAQRGEPVGTHPAVAEVATGLREPVRDGALLVVPVPTADGTHAALSVQRRRTAFDADDTLALLEVARRAGLALDKAAMLAEQRSVAETLQHGLLRELPDVPGLRIAARYLPAFAGNEVGGDWYDAFLRPDGRLAVVVGDVVGHDIAAATRMGELSTLVRATAYDFGAGPAAALERVDALVAGLGADAMSSVVLAYLQATSDGVEVVWSSAGHPSPLVVDPTGRTRVLQGSTDRRDILLGVRPGGRPRRDLSTRLGPGEALLLYTDGLVERRREDLDESLGWLRVHIARRTADGVRSVEELTDALLRAATASGTRDDVAVLAVGPA